MINFIKLAKNAKLKFKLPYLNKVTWSLPILLFPIVLDGTWPYLNLNSLRPRRYIRLGHRLAINAGLRLHGVPNSTSSSLHCSTQSPPSAAMLILVSLFLSTLRRPPECHSTIIRWILSRNLTDSVPSPHPTTNVSASVISRTVLLGICLFRLV